MLSALVNATLAAAPLTVGVTLHPYYSWAANVTEGLPVEVVPVIPGDVDVGSYQPRPQDVATLARLDVLVVNGLGHDAFIDEMVKASGNARVKVVRLNEGTPVLVSHGAEGPNSHTFLSFGNAMAQTFVLARALAELRPEWRATLEANAASYTKRLRALRATAVTKLARAKQRRVITVHDGYSYLLQELGLELAAVVEPAHGLLPTAQELDVVVGLVKRNEVRVVLSEASFPPAMLAVLREAGAEVTVVSHVATGDFTARRFEDELKMSVEALVGALTR
ncbi:MAG: zinc ABC transporter substrate-binding protein [Myxococcaceae bacterium]|nr:zinc ABC transporter substrate-binding protein [Myxococcaceae bacterium]